MAVLLVEDDPALGRLLQTLVAREHLPVELVTRGDEALQAIEHGHHLAIVLDLMLPGMNGFEIMQQLSVSSPHLMSRIIVLTAVSQSHLDQLEFGSAIWRLIRKPFEVPEFIKTLRECIATHAARSLPERDHLARWLASQSAACGAAAALIVATSGRDVVLRATWGFGDGVAEEFFPVPLTMNYPLCVAARTARPVWLPSVKVKSPEYPLLLPIWMVNKRQAVAAVPLMLERVAIGAIGWSFVEPQPFGEKQRAALVEIAAEYVRMIPAMPPRQQLGV
jgi:CheY-like chemotaxis protein